MGLIKAALGAAGGVMADQWKEYFYCEAIPANILAVKGQKRAGARSSNTRGSDNIITNGSIIAVADGQCMLIVDENAEKPLARRVLQAKKDGLIDNFIFGSISAEYLTAVVDTL